MRVGNANLEFQEGGIKTWLLRVRLSKTSCKTSFSDPPRVTTDFSILVCPPRFDVSSEASCKNDCLKRVQRNFLQEVQPYYKPSTIPFTAAFTEFYSDAVSSNK